MPSTVPRTSPGPALRWLGSTLHAHVIGLAQVPEAGAVLVTQRAHAGIAHVVLARELGAQRAVSELAADEAAGVESREAGACLLVSIAVEAEAARDQLVSAIQLATRLNTVLLPLGVAAGAAVTVSGVALPLPWSRAVVLVDAPFQAPPQREAIPLSWAEVTLRLLERADGRARDALATWKHTGRSPASA